MLDLAGALGLLLLLAAAGGGSWLLYRETQRRRARLRLDEAAALDDARDAAKRTRAVRPLNAWSWLPIVPALAVAVAALGWHPVVATGTGALAGVLAHLALAARAQRRALELEEGLAEAIGLASSALRAGASPVDALEHAARALGGSAGSVLLDLTGRLRLGEDPEAAIAELADKVPLESFRLFALALGVQWRAGGSLQRSLAVVARAVRDRVELMRRIHTQAAPTRGSVFAFVAATAAIGFLMWQYDPANLERFLRSDTGSLLVGGAAWLQALGVFWMWRLSQIRV